MLSFRSGTHMNQGEGTVFGGGVGRAPPRQACVQSLSLWPSLWGRGLTVESTQRSRRPLAWTCREGGQVLGGQEPEAPGLGKNLMMSSEDEWLPLDRPSGGGVEEAGPGTVSSPRWRPPCMPSRAPQELGDPGVPVY